MRGADAFFDFFWYTLGNLQGEMTDVEQSECLDRLDRGIRGRARAVDVHYCQSRIYAAARAL
ncbi:hypothetical protein D3C81_1952620 [compost metagenome]